MNKPIIPGMTKTPYGLPLMDDAFLGCLSWAASETEVIESFLNETGIKWTPARTPIDRMIDEQTGRNKFVMAAFADYVVTHIWGEEEPLEKAGESEKGVAIERGA